MSAYREAAPRPVESEPRAPFWTPRRVWAALALGIFVTFEIGLVLMGWGRVTTHDVGEALLGHAVFAAFALFMAGIDKRFS